MWKPMLALLLATVWATATANTERVENFRLLDQDLNPHELYYYKDAKAIVLMVQGNACPIGRNLISDYKAIRDEFQSQGVLFGMINASLQDTREAIREEAEAFGIDMPILKDETQLIGEALDLDRTAEVLVISPKNWRIVYRGAMSDRVGYETQKQEASEHYLKDALNDVLAGRDVATPKRAAVGCIVNFPERERIAEHSDISYSETIAPLLESRCSACHRPEGIGPWAMTSYEMVRGFAPMIREVIRTRRMPPWEVDPELAEIHASRALTTEEKRTLVHWIEAGAPRGDGPDPLKKVSALPDEWPLGEPDLVVQSPAFTVPATGVVDYQFPAIENPLDDDVWVRAVSIRPGEGKVVHHVLIGTSEQPVPQERELEAVFENYLMGYAPGAESYIYPEGTGVFVKAGGMINLQMHYTAYGREVTDVSEVALYFHDEPPLHHLRQQVVMGWDLAIPPGAGDHEETGYFEFDAPAVIYSLFPHAHYRGKSTRFDLHYPDGRVEALLHVPRYDFNWQHTYTLEQPVEVPAGTRLVHSTIYDNSKRNPANPDASKTVNWGLQSFEEMLYGGFFFRWKEGTVAQPVHDRLQFNLRQFYGAMDDDFDGSLQPDEMPGDMRQAFTEGGLANFDQNEDGALSVAEYRAFVDYRMQQERDRAQQASQEQAGDQ
ncbi:MAG: redoxin domain-containing protein [Pseudomonadota bacterium]